MTAALLVALAAVVLAGLYVRLERDAAATLVAASLAREAKSETAHRDQVASLVARLADAETGNREQTAALIARLADSEAAHRAEVQALCQRLQAPELAVIAHQQAADTPDEEMPLTDEELAELQDRELALERIERMQREGMLT